MNKIVQYLLSVVVIVGATLLVNYLVCGKKPDFEQEKARLNQQIDSLNTVIKVREDSILVIEGRIAGIEAEIVSLQEKIQKKDQQITYFKGKGRFEYVHSPDSLHHELNDLIKQRLSQ